MIIHYVNFGCAFFLFSFHFTHFIVHLLVICGFWYSCSSICLHFHPVRDHCSRSQNVSILTFVIFYTKQNLMFDISFFFFISLLASVFVVVVVVVLIVFERASDFGSYSVFWPIEFCYFHLFLAFFIIKWNLKRGSITSNKKRKQIKWNDYLVIYAKKLTSIWNRNEV